MRLNKKTALITGGSKGIGKAIAQRFIKEGSEVIVFDIVKPDYDIEFYLVDISKEEQIEKAFLKIEQLDILVNNAGVYLPGYIIHTKLEDLDRTINVNMKGTYLMSKHAIPLIKKRKGTIINISSGLCIAPEPESPAYCSTKAAITMLTKCLAQEYASMGVRVNAILPGPIDTLLLRDAFHTKEEMTNYCKLNPMQKIGLPEDVAEVALFLASKEAKYVTGGMYAVDGGESSSSMHPRST
ncbi:MAG: SDR family oxidoreductase [Candidatus Aenigmarchaeota archaeon]|nr:SDR family oxidoreductase [Candidatus Aenigmarchaeota archaeon]